MTNSIPLGYLRNVDGDWTANSEESLKLLLYAHSRLNHSAEDVPLGEFCEGTGFLNFSVERTIRSTYSTANTWNFYIKGFHGDQILRRT